MGDSYKKCYSIDEYDGVDERTCTKLDNEFFACEKQASKKLKQLVGPQSMTHNNIYYSYSKKFEDTRSKMKEEMDESNKKK